MPQAPQTLPDPLNVAPGESGPNADEILSQLAGEEIDRLLAEAESPRGDPVPQVAVAKSTTAPVPPPPAAPSAPSAAEQDLNQQLDALFNQLNEETFAPEAPTVSAAPTVSPAPVALVPEVAQPAPLEQAQPRATEKLPAPATPAQVSMSLEDDVLAATELSAIAEAPAKKEAAPLPRQERESGASPVSLFLRPVAWLSGFFPETALDWMGKIAILTTVNAMAIFAYILIRRH